MKHRTSCIALSLLLVLCVASHIAAEEIAVDAIYYPPASTGKDIAILFLGGSEGGYPRFNYESFTQAGYPCMGLAYFGTENTPERLHEIPLEYFEEALRVFSEKPEVQGKQLIVYGGSKGGELALLLASRFPLIEGVIAKVPSSVVFQGIGTDSSSWSHKGAPIPFVLCVPATQRIANNAYVDVYRQSLLQHEAVERATIPVEQINGPVLLLSAKQDTMWPSTQMCESVMARLKDYGFKFSYEHHAYEEAGHLLTEGYSWGGGTDSGNQRARLDFQEKIFTYLGQLAEK